MTILIIADDMNSQTKLVINLINKLNSGELNFSDKPEKTHFEKYQTAFNEIKNYDRKNISLTGFCPAQNDEGFTFSFYDKTGNSPNNRYLSPANVKKLIKFGVLKISYIGNNIFDIEETGIQLERELFN
jgi:hypothetical protein